jgi:hypothetical protein
MLAKCRMEKKLHYAYASYNNETVNEVNGLLYNYKMLNPKNLSEGWQVADDSVMDKSYKKL